MRIETSASNLNSTKPQTNQIDHVTLETEQSSLKDEPNFMDITEPKIEPEIPTLQYLASQAYYNRFIYTRNKNTADQTKIQTKYTYNKRSSTNTTTQKTVHDKQKSIKSTEVLASAVPSTSFASNVHFTPPSSLPLQTKSLPITGSSQSGSRPRKKPVDLENSIGSQSIETNVGLGDSLENPTYKHNCTNTTTRKTGHDKRKSIKTTEVSADAIPSTSSECNLSSTPMLPDSPLQTMTLQMAEPSHSVESRPIQKSVDLKNSLDCQPIQTTIGLGNSLQNPTNNKPSYTKTTKRKSGHDKRKSIKTTEVSASAIPPTSSESNLSTTPMLPDSPVQTMTLQIVEPSHSVESRPIQKSVDLKNSVDCQPIQKTVGLGNSLQNPTDNKPSCTKTTKRKSGHDKRKSFKTTEVSETAIPPILSEPNRSSMPHSNSPLQTMSLQLTEPSHSVESRPIQKSVDLKNSFDCQPIQTTVGLGNSLQNPTYNKPSSTKSTTRKTGRGKRKSMKTTEVSASSIPLTSSESNLHSTPMLPNSSAEVSLQMAEPSHSVESRSNQKSVDLKNPIDRQPIQTTVDPGDSLENPTTLLDFYENFGRSHYGQRSPIDIRPSATLQPAPIAPESLLPDSIFNHTLVDIRPLAIVEFAPMGPEPSFSGTICNPSLVDIRPSVTMKSAPIGSEPTSRNIICNRNFVDIIPSGNFQLAPSPESLPPDSMGSAPMISLLPPNIIRNHNLMDRPSASFQWAPNPESLPANIISNLMDIRPSGTLQSTPMGPVPLPPGTICNMDPPDLELSEPGPEGGGLLVQSEQIIVPGNEQPNDEDLLPPRNERMSVQILAANFNTTPPQTVQIDDMSQQNDQPILTESGPYPSENGHKPKVYKGHDLPNLVYTESEYKYQLTDIRNQMTHGHKTHISDNNYKSSCTNSKTQENITDKQTSIKMMIPEPSQSVDSRPSQKSVDFDNLIDCHPNQTTDDFDDSFHPTIVFGYYDYSNFGCYSYCEQASLFDIRLSPSLRSAPMGPESLPPVWVNQDPIWEFSESESNDPLEQYGSKFKRNVPDDQQPSDEDFLSTKRKKKRAENCATNFNNTKFESYQESSGSESESNGPFGSKFNTLVPDDQQPSDEDFRPSNRKKKWAEYFTTDFNKTKFESYQESLGFESISNGLLEQSGSRFNTLGQNDQQPSDGDLRPSNYKQNEDSATNFNNTKLESNQESSGSESESNGPFEQSGSRFETLVPNDQQSNDEDFRPSNRKQKLAENCATDFYDTKLESNQQSSGSESEPESNGPLEQSGSRFKTLVPNDQQPSDEDFCPSKRKKKRADYYTTDFNNTKIESYQKSSESESESNGPFEQFGSKFNTLVPDDHQSSDEDTSPSDNMQTRTENCATNINNTYPESTQESSESGSESDGQLGQSGSKFKTLDRGDQQPTYKDLGRSNKQMRAENCASNFNSTKPETKLIEYKYQQTGRPTSTDEGPNSVEITELNDHTPSKGSGTQKTNEHKTHNTLIENCATNFNNTKPESKQKSSGSEAESIGPLEQSKLKTNVHGDQRPSDEHLSLSNNKQMRAENSPTNINNTKFETKEIENKSPQIEQPTSTEGERNSAAITELNDDKPSTASGTHKPADLIMQTQVGDVASGKIQCCTNNNEQKDVHENQTSKEPTEASASAVPSTSNLQSAPQPNLSLETIGLRLTELVQQIAVLTSYVLKDRSTPQFRMRNDVCWYHRKFGPGATKCAPPCNY